MSARCAGVAKLVYALDSKSSEVTLMSVRVRPPAPNLNPSHFNLVKIAAGVLNDQRIRIVTKYFEIEGTIIKVAEVYSFAGRLVQTRGHGDPVTGNDLSILVMTSSVRHVGQVSGNAEVLTEFLRHT